MLWLIIFGHLCITSFNYIIVRPGLEAFGLLPFALLRFVLASLCLWALVLARGYRPVLRRDWRALVLLAFIAIPCNQFLYLAGIGLVPPEHGALLYATTPVWVLLVARWLLGEPVTKLKLIGIPLAFAGVLIVFFERGIVLNQVLWGDLLLLLGVWAWAFYSVLGKPLSQKYGALQSTTLAISLGTGFFLPVMPATLWGVNYAAIPPLAWISLAYMAVLTSVLAYTVWYWLMMQMDTSKVAVLQNLQPVFTMVFTAWLVAAGLGHHFALEEHALTPLFVSGAVLTLAGVLVTQRG